MRPIVVENLVKVFGTTRAVDSISFEVDECEIFGLLGPNGAGKTTTIKILVTLLRPTAGKAYVAGYDVLKQPGKVRRNIGVVFQETTLDLELTARENLDLHARLYGMSRIERERRIEDVLNLVGLADHADALVKTFSGGMKRKLEIARGLMHSPTVLFLDEPTLGLDAATRRTVWNHISELRGDTTIVLTTHYIEEAEKLCDRVAIMHRGKIIALDRPSRLKDLVEGERIIVRGENLAKLIDIAEKVVERNGRLEIHVSDAEHFLPKLFEIARARGVEIEEVSVRKPSLEDVFIRLTGGETFD